MSTWADKISELEARGWSLTGMGKAIGLSPQAVSDIKQGRTKAPGGMAAVLLHNLHATGAMPPDDSAHEDRGPNQARRTPVAEDQGVATKAAATFPAVGHADCASEPLARVG